MSSPQEIADAALKNWKGLIEFLKSDNGRNEQLVGHILAIEKRKTKTKRQTFIKKLHARSVRLKSERELEEMSK
jgi:hypothetical protein